MITEVRIKVDVNSVKRRIQYIRDQAYMSAYAAGAKPEDYERFIMGEQRVEYDKLLDLLHEVRSADTGSGDSDRAGSVGKDK